MWMKIRPSTLNLVIHFQFRGQNSLCDLQILIGYLSSALFWLTNNVPGVPCDRYSKENEDNSCDFDLCLVASKTTKTERWTNNTEKLVNGTPHKLRTTPTIYCDLLYHDRDRERSNKSWPKLNFLRYSIKKQ